MADRARTHPVFAEKVRDLTGPTQQLRQAAKDVAALKESPGWAFLTQLYTHRREVLLDKVVNGPVLSQAEYASLTGMVSGIQQAQEAVDTVLYVAQMRERELEQAEEE